MRWNQELDGASSAVPPDISAFTTSKAPKRY